MAGLNAGLFVQQLLALIRKNFLIVVVRKPISFFLFIYGIPVAVLAVLLSIPDFTSNSDKYGFAHPAPLSDLADVVDKKLVIVQPPHLGPDVQRVVDALTEGIDPSLIDFQESDGSVANLCLANLRGVSPCYASVTFMDSPESTDEKPEDYSVWSEKNQIWSYVMRFDPARSFSTFDATTHDNVAERYQMPLQLAINKAIANISVTPEAYTYTTKTPAEKEREDLQQAVHLVTTIFVFALFACYLFIVYHHTSFITSERESGMSQLIDSMGGGSTAAARVLSWLVVFNIYCLPVFVIFGILHWQILFRSSNPGTLIGWQILLGLAVNSSTVFAAAFFKKSRVSAIYVIGGFLLLAVAAQVHAYESYPKAGPVGPYILSLLFPSSNFVFFAIQMCIWELLGKNATLSVQPKQEDPDAFPQVESYKLTQAEMLGFLAVQIIVYPVLAVLVEKIMHGIDFNSRSFDTTGAGSSTGAVVKTFDLNKRFVPNFFQRVFARKPTVNAVDGVSFEGHRGQILCLVGPNGSGKTTTLHMMSGFTKPTSGTVQLGVSSSEIGICPQRNTLWDDLTVEEHVQIWSKLKSARKGQRESISDLITSCDLENKRASKGKTLSGGQKRKLQLACMFVGGSSVCLIDECTSGLDPLSRRVIWEILLEQRARRSIVLTTHFLDEVDVLADQIVILTEGKINCQGPAAELKTLYGGGYRVNAPHQASRVQAASQYPFMIHQDRRVYTTPDSSSAAKLSSFFSKAGLFDVSIAGPQIEDVFLRVTGKNEEVENTAKVAVNVDNFELQTAQNTSFSSQLGTLFRKRLTVLKAFWFPYFWVVALPLIITPFLQDLVKRYRLPTCENQDPIMYFPYIDPLAYGSNYCENHNPDWGCDKLIVAPPSANETLLALMEDGALWSEYTEAYSFDQDYRLYQGVEVRDNPEQMIDAIYDIKPAGSIFMGSEDKPPVIGFRIGAGGTTSFQMTNIWAKMESGTEIAGAVGQFTSSGGYAVSDGIIYAVFFTLIQAIWPAAFVLYPAIEKQRKVRALQYANGVQRAPLWIAYGLFDAIFVLIIAIGCSAIVYTQMTWWNGPPMILLPILLLYGISAVLLGYVISHFVNGALKSFMATAGINLLSFFIVAIAFSLGSGWSGAEDVDAITNGLTFGLNIVIPIGNVFRALLIGANVRQIACQNGAMTPAGSIFAYGGPVLYLCIQVAVLLLIIIWIEGDLALFRRKQSKGVTSTAWTDSEKTTPVRTDEVEAERMRVEEADGDLLRMLGLHKSFGSNHAVQDVTLGLPPNDVMALLGPNGAGKSTLVNMIQSELSPDRGQILLQGEDSRTRSAQRYLGVCPQYDALDFMTTEKQLAFYARIKGIKDVKGNVNHIMARLDLAVHAKTRASKLSGGNKRKLSLAIALMGAPPVMVLDEPTSAMDAVAKRSFWKLVQDITPGRSVLLTTHSMEEADALATRAAIISGRLLAVGTTESLREKYSNVNYVQLQLSSAPNSSEEEMKFVNSWVQEKIPGAQLERLAMGGQVRFTIPGTDAQGQSPVPAVIELLEKEKDNIGVGYYSVGGATLERVFLSVVRGNGTQEEDGVTRQGFLAQFWRR